MTHIDAGHVVDVATRPITQTVAHAICVVLWSVEHIPVDVRVDDGGRINAWPVGRPLTTPEWVTATRAFMSVSDVRVRWLPTAV